METSLSAEVWVVEDLREQKLPAREIAAVLSASGRSVRIVDLDDGAGRMIAETRRAQPVLIVFSILFADRVDEMLQRITDLRAAGLQGHVTMVGPLAAQVSADLLRACPALDSVVCGPLSSTLARLAAAVVASQPINRLPGLAGRNHFAGSGAHAELSDLDAGFPFPVRDAELPSFCGVGFATLRASRGCYHACTFCLPSVTSRDHGDGYRLRPIDDLAEEIEALYHRGVRLFLFDDEQFLPPHILRAERVPAFVRMLKERNLLVALTIKCRPDDVDLVVMEALRDNGLLRVYVGIESGDDETLALLGKRVTAHRNAEALAMLHRLNIIADFRSLLFHPWSTLAGLEREMAFLDRVLPDVATLYDFHAVQVFPGTALASRLASEGRAHGHPWPLTYTIADPRVECLRQTAPQVFGRASGYAALHEAITGTWYRVLLERRFHPSTRSAEWEDALSAIVAGTNRRVLLVWREMLAFMQEDDLGDATALGARTRGWIAEMGSLCAESTGRLARLI